MPRRRGYWAGNREKGSYRLTRKGAVLIGLPGVTSLIEHHKILYQDLLIQWFLQRGRGNTAFKILALCVWWWNGP